MRLASVVVGVALGLAAILLAWCARPLRPPVLGVPPPPAAAPPTPSRPAVTAEQAEDVERLRGRFLAIPVAGLGPKDLRDTFADARLGHIHDAIDILAPRGTEVIAADDGSVVKLMTSTRGGLSVYQFDPSSTYCFYYAHLDRYALRLREGLVLRKGETIGYVGTSGNASWSTPHLHFAVFRLGPDKQWNRGTPINPFAIWVRRQ